MANKTPSDALSPEQQAARLKALEKPLGDAGEPAGYGEVAPIAWEVDATGPTNVAETPSGSSGAASGLAPSPAAAGSNMSNAFDAVRVTAPDVRLGELAPTPEVSDHNRLPADAGPAAGIIVRASATERVEQPVAIKPEGGVLPPTAASTHGRVDFPASAGGGVSGVPAVPVHSNTNPVIAPAATHAALPTHGSNVAAIIGGVDKGTVTEDQSVSTAGQIETSGLLTIRDADAGDARFATQSGTVGQYGSFSLSADGHWTYSADNSLVAIQSLKAGARLTDSITVTSADGTTHTLTVTLIGTNDTPALQAQSQAVTEDGSQLSGHLQATDLDSGDTQAFNTTATVAGFTLNADGSYTFDPSDPTYQHLASGQTQDLVIPVTVTDSAGASATQNLTITVTGANDGAVITGANTGSVTEDSQLTTSGQLTVIDIDDGEALFTAQPNFAGTYGHFTLATDGRWNYALDNSNPAIQALKTGDSVIDTLSVQSADGTTHQVSITINGQGDAAVIGGVDTGTVTEDQPVSTSGKLETGGQLTVTDPDVGQEHFTAQSNAAGTYGTFCLDQTGHWSYGADNSQPAIQQLKAGATLTDSFTVTSADGTSHTVTVTLSGTNDIPALSAQSQSVTEDGAQLTGLLLATDVDAGDSQSFSTQNPPAGFTLNNDGSYSFDPSDAAYQHLAAGQTQTLTIPVTVTDSAGATATQNLTITITGANDGAVIAGVDTGTVTEDSSLKATGQLSIQDVDDHESVFTAQSNVAGTYGSFSLATDGSWTYVLDNSKSEVQALKSGETKTENFVVQSADGTHHSITVTINGRDDGAAIGGVDTGAVTEDTQLTAGKLETSGQLTVTDPDVGQDHFTAQSNVAGIYGTFSLGQSGHWSYSADNSQAAIQQLKAGATLTDSFTISSADGTTHTVIVTLNGTNDTPALTAHTQAVTEDGALLTGHMIATDVDARDTQSFSTAHQIAGFTLNADGSYSFDPSDAAYQHLAAGQTQVLTIPVTVTDSAGATATQNLTITVTGANDGAVIAGVDTGTVTEDSRLKATGQLSIQDVDDHEAVFSAQSNTAGAHGSFTLAADGSWSYQLNNSDVAVQGLKAGATLTDSFTVNSADGTQHTIAVTIQGTNDTPSLLVRSHSVAEDGAQVSGKVLANDVDVGDTQSFSLTHPVAGFTLNADGSYTFDPTDAAYQHLAQGQRLTIGIDITVTDSAGAHDTQPLFITVTGTNDGAVITGVDTGSVTEDQTQTSSGKLIVQDIDDHESVFAAQSNVAGTYGTFNLTADGTWSYTLDNSKSEVQALRSGETRTENFIVQSADGTTHTVTVTLHGTNDAPVLIAQTHAVTEDGAMLSGHMVSTDADSGDVLTFSIAQTVDGFTLNTDGSYSFDPSHTSYQHLAAGQTQDLVIPVTVTDSAGASSTQNLTITITGTNDTPNVTGALVDVVTEDGSVVQTHNLPVMDFSKNLDGAVMTMGALATGGDMKELSVEFSVISDGQAINSNHHGATFLSYASSVHNNDFYVWRPDNLTVCIGNEEHPTGINIDDGGSHRVSVVWSSATGSLDVLVDGVVRHHADGYQQGYAITGGGTLVLGQDQDAYAPQNGSTPWDAWGFDKSDAFAGKLFNVALSNHAVGVQALTHTPLGQLLQHDSSLVVNIEAGSNGQIVDSTGNNQLMVYPGTTVQVVAVDSGLSGNLGVQSADGQLQALDVDDGQSGFQPVSLMTGTYGSFTMDAAGHWHYQLDNASPQTQALLEGQQVVDRFSVLTTDGTPVTVAISVIGRNDVAVVSGVDSGQVTEDVNTDAQGRLSATGDLQVVDVDAGQAQFQPETLTGQAGVLSLDASGHWEYHVDNSLSVVQNLGDAQVLNEHFTVRTLDGTQHSITVIIHGRDDGAVIAGVDTGAVTEDANLTAGKLETSGQLTVTDPDVGQDHFTAQTNATGTYGTFSLDQTGHWTYSADNSQAAIQQLKAGATLTDSFTVSSADGTTHSVTVTLNGTNDTPALTAQTQAVTEDGAMLSGQMVATDVDAGDTHSFSLAHAVAGFTLNADGSYSFDPADAAYQHLAVGQTQTLTIPVTVTDSAGASDTQNLTLVLHGTGDGAVIGGVDIGTITEDSTQATTGQLSVIDVDDGEAHFVAQSGVAGTYGTFTLNEQGQWSYQLDNSKPEVQALKTGDSVSDSFTVTSADGTSHQVTVNIAGQDDRAVIGGSDSGTVTEDVGAQSGFLVIHQQLSISDPDSGQAHFIAQSHVRGQHGIFQLSEDGNWSYITDNSLDRLQQLKAGATLTDSFVASSADGTTHTVTVTLTGTNDAPVLTAQSQSVSEDGGRLHGQMSAQDIDSGDTLSFSLAQPVDGFTLNADGSYSFDPADAAYQHLAAHQTQTLSIPVTVTDSAGATSTANLTITLTGTNDGAVIGGADSGSSTEDSTQATTGQLTVSDVDDGEAHFIAQKDAAGSYGHFSLDAQGQWTYQLDNSKPEVQALKSGDSVTEYFTVTSAGGSSHQVSITINGQDDRAVISGSSSGATSEDSTRAVSGKLRVIDPDAGEAHFVAQTETAGSYGHFTLLGNGSWTYHLDTSKPEVQALKTGDSVSDSFTVTTADGSTQQITVSIAGQDDGAVIGGVDSGRVTEDQAATLHSSGQLSISDPDAGQAHFTAQAQLAGQYGSFSLSEDGQWSYSADSSQTALQQLKAGATLSDSFVATSADGSTHTVTVTITGSNDAPVLTAQSQAVTEDGAKLTGQMVATDVDQGDTLHYSLTQPVDGFTLNADGHYSFDPANVTYQHLAAGQTQTLTIPVTVTDSAGAHSTQNLTITLTGTNDGATITEHGTPGPVKEDQHGAIDGHLSVADVDSGESLFPAQQGAGLSGYGNFTLVPQANGQALWSYSLDNSKPEVQQLGEGQVLHDSFSVHSADGTSHTVTVTIVGSNDAPVLTAQSQSVSEDGAMLSGQMVATDVDAGDTHSFSLAHAVAGFTLNADGSYSFDPADAAYQHLAAGQTQTLTIPVTVTDSAGATSTANLTIKLTGSNDGASISGGDTGGVLEDQNVDSQGLLHASGQLQIQDADTGQSSFVAQNGVATQYGHFSIDADGAWTYTVDNNSAQVQALKPGGTPGETGDMAQALAQALAQSAVAGFHAVGEALTQGQAGALAGVLDLTVQGAAFVLSGPPGTTPVVFAMDAQGRSTLGVDELLSWLHQGTGYELHLQGVQSDVQFFVHDRGDAGVLHGLPLSGAAMLADPESAAAHLSLAWHTPPVPGELNEVVMVSSADGTQHQIHLSITGTAENAVISGTDSGSVTEDEHVNGGQIEARGQLSISDADAGQAAFAPLHDVAGHYGQLSLDANGAWHYHADNASAALNTLGKGQSATETFVVKSVDGTAHTINITVHGADESYNVWSHLIDVAAGTWYYRSIAPLMRAGDAEALAELKVNFGSAVPHVLDANGHEGHLSSLSRTGLGNQVSMKELTAWMHDHPGGQLALTGGGSSTGVFFHDYYDEGGFHFRGGSYGSPGAPYNLQPVPVLGMPPAVSTHGPAANAAALLAGADGGSVLADGDAQLQTQGHLTVLDADGGQAHFNAQQSVKGQYGQFSIDAQGHWQYQADGHQSALQQLAAGKALSDSFTVTSADGTAHTVTVQLFGSAQNTAALIGGVDSAALGEDAAQVGGQLTVVDPDAGEAHFLALADAKGQHGQFSLDEQGHWQYRLDNADPAVQALKAGETLSDALTVHSADGSSHVLRISIQGSNDAPVLQAQSHSMTEDGNLLRGQMVAQDVDHGDVLHFYTGSNIPGFVLHDDGSYSFDPGHPDYQSLVAGQVRDIAIPVVVTDSSGARTSQFLTLHITGQNDGAVISGVDSGHLQLGQSVVTQGQLQVSDADSGEAGFALTSAKGSYGSLAMDAQGHWQYILDGSNSAVQQLSPQGSLTDHLTVHSLDGTAHTIDIQIYGDPNAAHPVVQPPFVQQPFVQPPANLAPGPDIYQGILDSVHGAGYQYRGLAAALDSGDLSVAANLAVSIAGSHVQVIDGSGQVVQRFDPITADYAAVMPLRDVMLWHAQGYRIVASNDSGADSTRMWLHLARDSHHLTVHLPDGSVINGWTDQWTFGELPLGSPPSSPAPPLPAAPPVAELSGANDGARITGDDYETLTEDRNVQSGQLQASGHLKVHDIDVGQEHFLEQQGLHGQYGTLDIDAHGEWHYTADNSQSAIQNLNSGQSLTDRITVQSVDGTRHDIVITVQGADEPVPPPLQGPALIQAPPANHVLQPHLVQSGDIYQQLIDTFLATNNPVYVAAAHAMQADQGYPLYGITLQIDGAGILITDPQGHVSTSIPATAGSASIDLGSLVDIRNMNPGQAWVQAFSPQAGSGEIRPWLHKAGDTGILSVHFQGLGGTLLHPGDLVAHPISVPFFAPPGGLLPSPAPAPDTETHQQHDDPAFSLSDQMGYHDVVIQASDQSEPTTHANHDLNSAIDRALPGDVHAGETDVDGHQRVASEQPPLDIHSGNERALLVSDTETNVIFGSHSAVEALSVGTTSESDPVLSGGHSQILHVASVEAVGASPFTEGGSDDAHSSGFVLPPDVTPTTNSALDDYLHFAAPQQSGVESIPGGAEHAVADYLSAAGIDASEGGVFVPSDQLEPDVAHMGEQVFHPETVLPAPTTDDLATHTADLPDPLNPDDPQHHGM